MKSSRFLWTLAFLVVGGGALAGCGKQPVVLEVQSGGKIFLRPKKGDVVRWVGADSQPVAVNFFIPGASPCKETGSSLNTCTVVDTHGVFPYACDGCADPAVVVGSDVPLQGAVGTARKARGAVLNAQAGYLYCDPASHAPKVKPDTLVATGGDTIQWFAAGPNIVDWSLILQSGTCNESTVNQSQPVCTVRADAPKSQNYPITADACAGTGSAGLTIK
jgi:plastocyanin